MSFILARKEAPMTLGNDELLREYPLAASPVKTFITLTDAVFHAVYLPLGVGLARAAGYSYVSTAATIRALYYVRRGNTIPDSPPPEPRLCAHTVCLAPRPGVRLPCCCPR